MKKFLLRFLRRQGDIGDGCGMSVPDCNGKQLGMKNFLLRFGSLISVEAARSSRTGVQLGVKDILHRFHRRP